MNNLHVVLLAVVALAASRAALATEDITFVPVRFAPLVASPTLGVRPSDEPAAQVLHNEFLRVIHGQLKIGLVCEPSYYDISEKTELVYYDAERTAHRSGRALHCQLNAIKMDDDFQVAHCQHTGVQFGHVDAVHNRSAVVVEGCCNNATDHIVYARSRLQRLSADGRQLPLERIQLRAYQPDDIGHNAIDLLLTEMPSELFDALNEPIMPDTLPWSDAPATAVRSYEAWDVFLWNAHKLGFEYLAFDAPRMSGRLESVVELLRGHVRDLGNVEWMTGYVGETEVDAAALAPAADRQWVKVPKYVWLVVATGDNAAIAYVVPNGAERVDEAELCTDRCDDERVHCCAVADLGRHVRVLRETFGEGVELL